MQPRTTADAISAWLLITFYALIAGCAGCFIYLFLVASGRAAATVIDAAWTCIAAGGTCLGMIFVLSGKRGFK
jgi:hypothetical protein